ncbi:DUF1877 family protein [Croceivirga sp. JEA036]|uniref:DUF1877 family protein n=1 Tax=Croceivirga sp. JEA036 TaxID=2721162 RepID=UPI00143BEF97|nr:DUF1877 family protein [Croceivirga sp. JEA036]NJB37831.1 DUF1877 family protein [Croceivirga sp. JEA036]
MGQRATLYRVDKKRFEELRSLSEVDSIEPFIVDFAEFEKNHEGLKYLLVKWAKPNEVGLIEEIFYPSESLFDGTTEPNPDDPDEWEKYLEEFDNDSSIPFLNPEKTKTLGKLLTELNDQDFILLYNSKEMNKNKVYPWCWHDEEKEDLAFNKTDILQGIEKLKKILIEAGQNGDYILSSVG